MKPSFSLPKALEALISSPPAPAHYEWSLGRKPFSSPIEARSSHFRFSFLPSIPRRPYSFREEILRAAADLDSKRKGRPVALCYSGGLDSDLIAGALTELGIPFDLFFLDIWGINRGPLDEFSPQWGKMVQEIRLDRTYFYESHSLRQFRDFGCELPTYLALTYLFEQIPKNYFIVTGGGDLEISSDLGSKIAALNPVPPGQLHLPFPFGSVYFHLWAKKHRRAGEFYFFRSRPELVAATFQHPSFRHDSVSCSPRQVIYEEFPELKSRCKTTNWDGEHSKENRWVRNWLTKHAEQDHALSYWQRSIGSMVSLEKIFLE